MEKLDISQQIDDLKKDGIKFELCSEEDAKRFLRYNTYYFKIKAYERNFRNSDDEKDKHKKLRDVDFEHLRALSKIDAHLRKIIIRLCLDIEHILKAQLIYDCTVNPETDGFDFVAEFRKNNPGIDKEIINKAKKKYASSLLAKSFVEGENESEHVKDIPLWSIVELLSFGEFSELYRHYYTTYSKRPNNYSIYLRSIQYLRNASAHNNCLIHNLKKNSSFSKTEGVTNALSRANHIPKQTKTHKMSIPVVHDFVTLLFVYNDLLNSPYNRSMREREMNEIRKFFNDEDGRIKKSGQSLKSNQNLYGTYKFIQDVIQFIDNEHHKPKNKRFLKTI